jgi:hypothetical protein
MNKSTYRKTVDKLYNMYFDMMTELDAIKKTRLKAECVALFKFLYFEDVGFHWATLNTLKKMMYLNIRLTPDLPHQFGAAIIAKR